MPNDKKKTILQLWDEAMQDTLGKTEFLKAFQQVIDYVKESDEKNTKAVEAIAEALQSRHDELKGETSTGFEAHKNEALQLLTSKLLEFASRIDEKLAQADEKILAVRDGVDGKDGADAPPPDIEAAITRVQENLPQLGESIVDAINLLPTDNDEDKIDVSHIKGLEKEIKRLAPSPGANLVISRGAVKGYDLSSSLDGSTRTFNTPVMWRPISVHLSSSPNILRETVDFTWTPQTITFTSEVADNALAAGQTCVLVYMEP